MGYHRAKVNVSMLIFGHTGITLGAAVLLNATLTKGRSLPTRTSEPGLQSQSSAGTATPQYHSHGVTSWFTSLAERLDIRLLLIGSLLPDIIDKPVGMLFFRDTFSNGRIFSHTLLFLTLITIGGLFLYWTLRKNWLLVLAFGTFFHLVLDEMWATPQTLLWPLYGFSFPKIDFEFVSWLEGMLYTVSNNPAALIPELLGAAVIIWLIWLIVRRGEIYAFLKNGQL